MGQQLKLSAGELKVVIAYLGPEDALSNELPASYRCYRHTVVNIHSDQLATSVAHRRSFSLSSSYVLCQVGQHRLNSLQEHLRQPCTSALHRSTAAHTAVSVTAVSGDCLCLLQIPNRSAGRWPPDAAIHWARAVLLQAGAASG